MTTEAIVVHRVGKKFRYYNSFRPRTLMEAALSWGRGMKAVDTVWALRDVSFTVGQGQMLGILGHNGAGKSTLLRLIGEVGRPDKGKILTYGRLGSLLELGAGFHPDLTGLENIFVTAAIYGFTEKQTRRKLNEIVSFSELNEFIEHPLRTYSTGMQMRLAFSIAVHTDPDVLLVDEVLAVGDIAFQSKCVKRIKALQSQGCAVILVSHSPEQIQNLCDTALWLERGVVKAYGSPAVVAGQYTSTMRSQTLKRTPSYSDIKMTDSGVKLVLHKNRFGSLEAEIEKVNLLPDSKIFSGRSLSLEIQYRLSQGIDTFSFIITITNMEGQSCLNKSTDLISIESSPDSDIYKLDIYLEQVSLEPGNYYLDVGMYKKDWSYAYDYHWNVYSLTILENDASSLALQPSNYCL